VGVVAGGGGGKSGGTAKSTPRVSEKGGGVVSANGN
jgi:hypothetical protein